MNSSTYNSNAYSRVINLDRLLANLFAFFVKIAQFFKKEEQDYYS